MHNSEIFLDSNKDIEIQIQAKKIELQFPLHMTLFKGKKTLFNKEEIFVLAYGVNKSNSRLEFFLSNGEFRFLDTKDFQIDISQIKIDEFGYKLFVYEKLNDNYDICSCILNVSDLIKESFLISKIKF